MILCLYAPGVFGGGVFKATALRDELAGHLL
jgi:hypothetical protein